jgi:CHAT domain-containing protein/tetratricopeptide (TPR) repeat protein
MSGDESRGRQYIERRRKNFRELDIAELWGPGWVFVIWDGAPQLARAICSPAHRIITPLFARLPFTVRLCRGDPDILRRLRRALGAFAVIVALAFLSSGAHAVSRGQANVFNQLLQQGSEYQKRGDYDNAARSFERAIGFGEKVGADRLVVDSCRMNLADVYNQQGRYADAEILYKRALLGLQNALGPNHPTVASAFDNFGVLYFRQGRFADAELLHKRGLEIRERTLGANHPDVAMSLHNLANLYGNQGRYAEAEAFYERALNIKEKALGPGDPLVASSANALGLLYYIEGRYAEAETLEKRALTIYENAVGPDHPAVVPSLNNLAGVYLAQDRYADAEALFTRILTVDEKVLGPDHPGVAIALNNIAQIYFQERRYAEAESLNKRALAIREKALGPFHPDVGNSLANLADVYAVEGRYAEAESLERRALTIREKALGPDHPEFAKSLYSLAALYVTQGRYADAEQLQKRALAIREKAFGSDHPDVAASLFGLALFYDGQGRQAEALDATRRATAILAKRSEQGGAEISGGSAGKKEGFLQLVRLLSRAAALNGPAPEIVDEAFRAAQYAGGIDTARALAGMAARAAAGSDALAVLVRERQDLATRWQKLDADLLKAVSQTTDKRNPNSEAALRKEQAEVDAKLKADDERLRADFPRFADLAAARPVSVADIQSVLASNEALVAWTLGDTESYLFVIHKDGAHFFKLDITSGQAAATVQVMRKMLTSEAPFDITKAHDFYKSLFGPAENLVADAKHLILVPDRALQSLPPSLLVTASPTGNEAKTSDYKSVAWLIRRQPLSVLPAASSLVSLRLFAETRHAADPFAGFGDPDFRGGRGTRGIAAANLYRGAAADLDGLRHLPRLEETAGELRAEAKALGAPESSVHLGLDASVTRVKSLDLSNTKVVAFATHGLIAGDLPQLAEPALVLTPPANPTPDDDGLLRASQVSQLKLNADFVILSACNTAAPDGKPGADGLSGLAKAFFYAGARSILVSHWPVDSDATVKLTTGLIRAAAADPSIGRAEALRRSILSMIDSAPANSNEAHPALWAPFILAGEGGAKR